MKFQVLYVFQKQAEYLSGIDYVCVLEIQWHREI